ncbi:hypothetical protein PIB30_054308 [Stylosanthes scabra]|uniref:Uncharacterized protein n=1 Tax=Stylosanthes scabra TaxID=79078 RepID=A0ABU6QIF4_9FABA|nr:hypothetical protein [Stylosanthes scabra]
MDIDAEERLPTLSQRVETSSGAFTSPQQTSLCTRFTKEATDRQSDGRNALSHDILGVWQLPLSGAVDGVENWGVTGEAYDMNEQDMNEVVRVIGKDGATSPSVPGRLNKEILNKEA